MGIRLITNIRTQPMPVQGTLYRGKFSGSPSAYVAAADADSFVGFLRTFYSRRITIKDDLELISPAIFDPARPGATKRRGLENIEYVRHLWLDFENGDLGHHEFAALFPGVRLIATNSFHHRADKPRFRAVILNDRPVTAEAHQILFDNVARKIEDAGYSITRGKKASVGPNGRSGLDWSKRTPTSLFYLPSQAANARDSFFIDYNEPGRELLNPVRWIENSVVPTLPASEHAPSPETPRPEINHPLVERATREWRAALEQQGNREFFRLALRLRRAGLSPYGIETRLNAEADFGRSPKERRAQVKSIISSLRRSRPR
jgi:hypothetical protein